MVLVAVAGGTRLLNRWREGREGHVARSRHYDGMHDGADGDQTGDALDDSGYALIGGRYVLRLGARRPGQRIYVQVFPKARTESHYENGP